jgi:hypothetical protein
MKAYATQNEFLPSFGSPLPVASAPDDLFGDLDHDDFRTLAPLPPEPRGDVSSSPNRDVSQRVTVVKPTAEGPILRLIPDARENGIDDDRSSVPASLIRKIERELRDDMCDPGIVFRACRNLRRGSREFEVAYTNARVRAYVRQPRRANTTPAPPGSTETTPQLPAQRPVEHGATPEFHHPLAVWTLSDLMGHLGLPVIVLLAAQTWASWKIAGVLNQHLGGGPGLYVAGSLCVMLSANAYVWFRRRGRLFDQFFAPGAVLFMVAVVPGLVIHFLGTLAALE